MTELTTIIEGRRFLEAPRWHADRIWASDIYAHEVISARADGSDLRVEAVTSGLPCGLGFLPDGDLLISMMDEHRIVRRHPNGELSTYAEIPVELGHLNDMTTSDNGDLYVAATGYDPTAGAPTVTPGYLAHVNTNGDVNVVAHDLLFPNGMIIDTQRLILAESFGNRITTFDISANGSLDNRHEFARFGEPPATLTISEFLPHLSATPDGICNDGNGGLWIADPERRRTFHLSDNATITRSITSDLKLFACARGGADGHTLFICAAPDSSPSKRTTAHEGQLLAASSI